MASAINVKHKAPPTVNLKAFTPSNNYVSPVTTKRNPGLLITNQFNSPMLADIVNDDSTEKRNRLRSRLSDMALRKVITPTHDSVQSKSTTPAAAPTTGWNPAQITEHLNNCIQLARDNKINTKNAFSLHLIDSMKDLLNKEKETNFQMAGSTVEAGAKIYASRVDALHLQAMHVHDQVTQLDKRGDDAVALRSQSEQAEDEESTGNVRESAPKRNKKKKKIISTDTSKLNMANIQQMHEIDPLIQKLSKENDSSFGGLLLSSLRSVDDHSCQMLDMFCSALPDPDFKHCETKLTDHDFPLLKLADKVICPTFNSFEFNSSGVHPIFTALHHMDELRFDPDKEVSFRGDEGSLGAPGDDDFMDDIDQAAPAGTGSEVVDYMGSSKQSRLAQSTMTHLTDGSMSTLMNLVTGGSGDYSFFNCNIKNIWAGPSHWKMKLHIAPGDKRPGQAGVGNSNKRIASEKKVQFTIDFTEEIDFDAQLKKTRAATVVSEATLKRYSKLSLTLPEDLHYENDDLVKLFTRPNVMVKKSLAVNDDACDDGNNEADGYDYENKTDRENFCPNISMTSGGDDGGDDFSLAPSQPTLLDLDDTLVAQPKLVQKINLQYAKRAKKIDFKRLKRNMWNFIAAPHNKENIDGNMVNCEAVVEEVTEKKSFHEMYGKLPALCPSHEARDLSMPIAFVALLHLCNEKNLFLDSATDHYSDLIISGGEA